MIEDYVQWGGDHGLTESTMREACGLPPRDMREISNRAQAIIQVDDDDKDVDKDPDKEWELLRKFIVSHLLELRRPDITKPMLLRVKAPGGPNLTKENLIKELVNNQILAETPARGKTAEVYRPLLTCSNLQKVVAFKQKHLEMIFPETLQARGFVEYVQGCPARRENALVLGRFFCAAKSPPLRGRPPKTDTGALDKSDAYQERGRKLLEQEKLFDEILRELIKLTGDPAPASTQEAQPAKRRRIKSKELLKVKEESDDAKPFVQNISIADVQETLHTQRAYVYSGEVPFRSRRTVKGPGVQKFCRRAVVHLAAKSLDLDVENSVFTLMYQLIEKLTIRPPPPDYVKETLRQCAKERDRVCREILKTSKASMCPCLCAVRDSSNVCRSVWFRLSASQADGKSKLIKVFNGGGIPSSEGAATSFFENLSRVSIYCRWLAISCFPDEHARFQQPETKKKNPDSSILSYFYHALEDVVLSAAADYLLGQNPKHLSLHYDGVRVSPAESGTTEEVCNKLQEHVKQTTGFDVVVREKVHRTVLQIILEEATSKRVSVLSPNSVLRGTGNCIPAAVSLLLERTSDVEQAVVADSQGQGAESRAPTRPSTRSYRECEKLLGVNLIPHLPENDSTSMQLQPGNFLLHMENGGTPHCVGLCVPDDLSLEITVLDASNNISIQTSSLDSALRDGVDGITCILFNVTHAEKQISPHTCWEPDGLEGLLDLEAGAAEAIEVLSEDDCPESVASSTSEAQRAADDSGPCLDSDAQVLADSKLIASMEQEVTELMCDEKKHCFEQTRQGLRCPFCPWRCFRRARFVLQHIQKRHTSKKQYCSSGTKQLKVVLALHDTDVIAGLPKRGYLRESAELLRQLLICKTKNRSSFCTTYMLFALLEVWFCKAGEASSLSQAQCH